MPSENILETYRWLKAEGFMVQTDEDKVRERGLSDGKAAGAWVIDGNSSDAYIRALLTKMDDCDAGDMLPELQLGQWAGDPQFVDILADIDVECDEDSEDDLWCVYSDAWYEGMQAEAERACRARLEVES